MKIIEKIIEGLKTNGYHARYEIKDKYTTIIYVEETFLSEFDNSFLIDYLPEHVKVTKDIIAWMLLRLMGKESESLN